MESSRPPQEKAINGVARSPQPRDALAAPVHSSRLSLPGQQTLASPLLLRSLPPSSTGFYWHLYQDATISFEARLTGIVSTNSMFPNEQTPEGGEPLWGTRLALGLNAQIHQARERRLPGPAGPAAAARGVMDGCQWGAGPCAPACASMCLPLGCLALPMFLHTHARTTTTTTTHLQHFFMVRMDPAIDCLEGGKRLQVWAQAQACPASQHSPSCCNACRVWLSMGALGLQGPRGSASGHHLAFWLQWIAWPSLPVGGGSGCPAHAPGARQPARSGL